MIFGTVFYCVDHEEEQAMVWDETIQDHRCPKCGKVSTLEPRSMITLEAESMISRNGIHAVEVRMGTTVQ